MYGCMYVCMYVLMCIYICIYTCIVPLSSPPDPAPVATYLKHLQPSHAFCGSEVSCNRCFLFKEFSLSKRVQVPNIEGLW